MLETSILFIRKEKKTMSELKAEVGREICLPTKRERKETAGRTRTRIICRQKWRKRTRTGPPRERERATASNFSLFSVRMFGTNRVFLEGGKVGFGEN